MKNAETPIEATEGNAIPPDLETTAVCMALMQAGASLAAVFEQGLSEAGISQPSFRALMALSELQGTGDNGIILSRLADYLALDQMSAESLADRLVSQGLVERHTDSLCLTPTGHETLQKMMPSVVTVANQALKGVSSEEISRLLSLLGQMEADIRATLPLVSVL